MSDDIYIVEPHPPASDIAKYTRACPHNLIDVGLNQEGIMVATYSTRDVSGQRFEHYAFPKQGALHIGTTRATSA